MVAFAELPERPFFLFNLARISVGNANPLTESIHS